MTLTEAATRLQFAAIGLLKRRQVDAIAAKHRPKIAAFFRRQKTLTLEKFKGLQFLFTESYRALREEISPNQFLTPHDFDRLWSEIDRDTFDELQGIIAAAESDGVLKGAAFSAKQFGTIVPGGDLGSTFNLANPRAVAWFQKNGGSLQYIKNIQETTRTQLQTIIVKAINEGKSYNQTAKEIRVAFEGISRHRAQLIATNESAHAYESGSYMFEQGLVADGIELEKSWQNVGDTNVTEGCLKNTATGWIPFTQEFPSGHQHPPRFPGCRCHHITRQVKRDPKPR